MEIEQGKLPPPPGLISSIARGFDAVANHISVILPPLLLDLFLWLGPHLRLTAFLQKWWNLSKSTLALNLPAGTELATLQESWTKFAEQFNLFMALRTFPVGTPSLLSFEMPVLNPLGNPASRDAGSIFGILGWIVLLLLVGWVAGAFYYYWVAGISMELEKRSLWKSISQAVFLSAIWAGMLMIVGVPLLFMFGALMMISPAVAQVALFAGSMVLVWLVMPVFFSAHGIFTFQLDALRAILNSLRMVRFTLPNIALFLLIFVVINQGLNFLWNTPADGSWWMLVGIGGHAFVSTALLAASFIYYRDINGWLKVVFEQLQKQTTTVKA